MKTFKEYLSETQPLEERFLRRGTVAGLTAVSTAKLKKAEAEFQRGSQILKRPDPEDLLERIEQTNQALAAQLEGLRLLSQASQLHVAANAIGQMSGERRKS